MPASPGWAQWPVPGISWLSVECSGGSGWGRLKEAPLWVRALIPALGQDFIHQRGPWSSGLQIIVVCLILPFFFLLVQRISPGVQRQAWFKKNRVVFGFLPFEGLLCARHCVWSFSCVHPGQNLHCTENEAGCGEIGRVPNYTVGSLQRLIPNSHTCGVVGMRLWARYATWEKDSLSVPPCLAWGCSMQCAGLCL